MWRKQTRIRCKQIKIYKIEPPCNEFNASDKLNSLPYSEVWFDFCLSGKFMGKRILSKLRNFRWRKCKQNLILSRFLFFGLVLGEKIQTEFSNWIFYPFSGFLRIFSFFFSSHFTLFSLRFLFDFFAVFGQIFICFPSLYTTLHRKKLWIFLFFENTSKILSLKYIKIKPICSVKRCSQDQNNLILSIMFGP